jgi:hypothetical protein
MADTHVAYNTNGWSYADALKLSEKYFDGDEIAAKVYLDKYALKYGDQILEPSPQFMHRRLAKEFARIEKKKFKDPMNEELIFAYLDRFKHIIPQGSPIVMSYRLLKTLMEESSGQTKNSLKFLSVEVGLEPTSATFDRRALQHIMLP